MKEKIFLALLALAVLGVLFLPRLWSVEAEPQPVLDDHINRFYQSIVDQAANR